MRKLLFILALALATPASAQSDEPDLARSVIAGGGGRSGGDSAILTGTVGQAATGAVGAGVFSLRAGFWVSLSLPATETPTPTSTAPATLSASPTLTPTSTAVHSATPPPTSTTVLTPSATRSSTPVATASSSPTITASPVVTPTSSVTPLATSSPSASIAPTQTATPIACVGDCDGDGAVTVDEIVLMVGIGLGIEGIGNCVPADLNGDGDVTVDEIVNAVTNALDGCRGLGSSFEF